MTTQTKGDLVEAKFDWLTSSADTNNKRLAELTLENQHLKSEVGRLTERVEQLFGYIQSISGFATNLQSRVEFLEHEGGHCAVNFCPITDDCPALEVNGGVPRESSSGVSRGH